jgi:hypothetical protein
LGASRSWSLAVAVGGYTSALTRPQALIAGDPPVEQDTRYFGIEPGEVVLDVGACRGGFHHTGG